MKIVRLCCMVLMITLICIGCSKDIKKEEIQESADGQLEEEVNPDTLGSESKDENKIFLKDFITKENYPIVDGSTATIPLSEAVYQVATGATKEEAEANIVHTKTSNAYYRLMNKEADLLIVYEPSEEVLQYQKKSNQKLLMKPIGKDALVFMANASNPVESLTTKQLVDIYSGKVSNWSEVDGNDQALLAFQRPAGSGSQTLMEKHVMKGTPMEEGVNVSYYSTMEGILEAMAEYNNLGNSLGYSVFYYARNMYQLPELKFMKINEVEPSLESIYDNTYPYINEFYAVIREEEPENSPARIIYDWLTQEEGQTLVAEQGYVPVEMEFKALVDEEERILAREIPQGYRYIATSKLWGGSNIAGKVTIYKDSWEQVREFQGGEIYDGIGLIKENKCIVIGINTEVKENILIRKFGVYSLEKDEFVIPTSYDVLNVLDEDKGYYVVLAEEDYQVINLQGDILASGFSQGEGLGASKKGDYFWITRYSSEISGEIVTVYDGAFKEIRQFQKAYWDEYAIYHNDGTPFVTEEIFLQKQGLSTPGEGTFTLVSQQNLGELISICYNKKAYVYDKDWNLLASKDVEDEYNDYYLVYDGVYSDYKINSETGEERHIFYDQRGKAITNALGKPYTHIVDENYNKRYYLQYYDKKIEDNIILYTVESNQVHLINYDTKEEYVIDLSDWSEVKIDYVKGDIIILKDQNGIKTRVYKGTKLIKELDGNYSFSYLDGRIEQVFLEYYDDTNSHYYIIIDREGKIEYQSKYGEIFKSVDELFIQVHRGSYYIIMDYNGNIARKEYQPTLMND